MITAPSCDAFGHPSVVHVDTVASRIGFSSVGSAMRCPAQGAGLCILIYAVNTPGMTVPPRGPSGMRLEGERLRRRSSASEMEHMKAARSSAVPSVVRSTDAISASAPSAVNAGVAVQDAGHDRCVSSAAGTKGGSDVELLCRFPTPSSTCMSGSPDRSVARSANIIERLTWTKSLRRV